jgi:molybdopterin converting factor small subunit
VDVQVLLPAALASANGGARRLSIGLPDRATVADLLSAVEAGNPLLGRRIRDETGSVRRYVNVYVDGEDIRHGAGTATPVADGSVVQILPCIAGG